MQVNLITERGTFELRSQEDPGSQTIEETMDAIGADWLRVLAREAEDGGTLESICCHTAEGLAVISGGLLSSAVLEIKLTPAERSALDQETLHTS